jgi:diacylglycerol kinase (ATP)
VSIVILTNAASRYNRTHSRAQTALEAGIPGARHIRTRCPAEIDAAVDAVLACSPRLLAINGGDGTVQHTLTALLRRVGVAELPPLALLPGGTTNMTARAINGRALSFQDALRRLAAAANEVVTAGNVAVEVALPSGEHHWGFFWGMGAILRGIEYCQQHVYRTGIGGEQAPAIALVRTAWGITRRQPPFSGGVTVDLAGGPITGEFDASIFLVTALDQLFLGIRPFWGGGAGALRGLMVEEPADRLLRNMPALLRGRPNRHMTPAHGYSAFRLDRLEVRSAARFTLDGEFHDIADGTLELSATPPIAFVRLGEVCA